MTGRREIDRRGRIGQGPTKFWRVKDCCLSASLHQQSRSKSDNHKQSEVNAGPMNIPLIDLKLQQQQQQQQYQVLSTAEPPLRSDRHKLSCCSRLLAQLLRVVLGKDGCGAPLGGMESRLLVSAPLTRAGHV